MPHEGNPHIQVPFAQPQQPTLGQQRASAIRTALGGLARNIGLSDVEKQVLAQRELEETPLSGNERALAGVVLQDYFSSHLTPGAAPEDVQRLTATTLQRMNRRDYNTLIQVVGLGMQKQKLKLAEESARRPRAGPKATDFTLSLNRAMQALGKINPITGAISPVRAEEVPVLANLIARDRGVTVLSPEEYNSLTGLVQSRGKR